ncbi:MAG: nucleotide sugar dehydrogenase [Candidatus Andersenbacteria bacterium]
MNTEKNLVVVGLGYVGLPLALLAQEKGWTVAGLDIDEEKVGQINSGTSPLEDAIIERDLKRYPITATTDASVVSSAQAVVVAVPTPVTDSHEPDLRPLKSALESILPHLQPGQLLSIESTINPGVMHEIVVPILETRSDLPLQGDNALQLVHCPERINPGDTTWTIRNIPRVIGGYTPQATDAGVAFYGSILEAEIKPMGSLTEAEAVKIFENTFRDINIAFVNEMAKSFDKLGIDVTHVIEGASTKPFAFLAHYPGNGVGGHCISVDPYYMIERAKQVGFDHQFLRLARQINDSMPAYTLERMDEAVEKLGIEAPTVALLGLAYKKNIDDIRESPCLTIRSMLEKRNGNLRVFDPHVLKGSTTASLDEAVSGADVVILGTNHDEFISALTPEYLKKHNVRIVIDGKNALDGAVLAAAGILYYGIGRSVG